MQIQLRDGAPKDHEYKILLGTDKFKELENFSNAFLKANQENLGSYSKKWVNDPLHQWSRQWEYPYVLNQIQAVSKDKDTVRILDAGSGVTFFPYYIKSLYSFAEIHCTDYDKNLETVYEQINFHNDNKIAFSCCNLKTLPFDDDYFDIIYCVSVLEHTDDHLKIAEEFLRVLRPGGRLIITFDVSLDGTRDISIEKGDVLLRSLARRFVVTENISLDLESHVKEPGIFTTLTAKDIDSGLLPWRLPSFVYRFKSLVTAKKMYSWPPPLTVFCISLTKHDI